MLVLARRVLTVTVLACLLAVAPPDSRADAPGPPDAWVPVEPGVVGRSVAYGPGGVEQSLDVYAPAVRPGRARPTVLLVHGGGWRIGASTEWRREAVEIVRSRGWTAVSVNYRLTKTAPWPAQRDDLRAAVAKLTAEADVLGVDLDRVGALGDSAGGHLAAMLAKTPDGGPPPVKAVVTWSGINDLAGLTEQELAGGCAVDDEGCTRRGLARTVVEELLGCTPQECPHTYRTASPAADVRPDHPATLAFGTEEEQVDPRQAWVMDAALDRQGVTSRVRILPGRLHARGYQPVAWRTSLDFLAAHLTPETSSPFPAPTVRATLDVPAAVRAGREVTLSGQVDPGQAGSTVQVQVRGGNGVWRTVRTPLLEPGGGTTTWTATWEPARAGTTTWRALWRGSGTTAVSEPVTVVVR